MGAARRPAHGHGAAGGHSVLPRRRCGGRVVRGGQLPAELLRQPEEEPGPGATPSLQREGGGGRGDLRRRLRGKVVALNETSRKEQVLKLPSGILISLVLGPLK